jgi:methylated-DNA-[protein]-cysteine S-methyltransferase
MNARSWWVQETPVGPVHVVASGSTLHTIGFGDVPAPELLAGADSKRDRAVALQLDDWFAGRRHEFDLAVDLGDALGPFGRAALTTLHREVGWGETVSYGELAAMAGRPRAARAVGAAMARNPILFVIPCHRVLAAGGRLGGYGGPAGHAGAMLDVKRALLAHEQIALAHAG